MTSISICNFTMVHPEGFEPPISGTGNLRFIQLSYGCTYTWHYLPYQIEPSPATNLSLSYCGVV